MKKRFVAPAALALAVVAGVGGEALPAATASASGNTLTVWLMTGDSIPAVVNSVNSAFTTQNPGWTVNVEVQQWGGISTKLITALAGSTPPDVMEIGNTDVAEFAASGGLTNLAPDKSQFENSSKWLTGLAGTGRVQRRPVCHTGAGRRPGRCVQQADVRQSRHHAHTDQPPARIHGSGPIYRSPCSVKNFSPWAKRFGLRKKPSRTAPLGATASC